MESQTIPHWHDLTCRYKNDKDCLASYLIWQAPEVISGVKPANLFSLTRRPLTCGRDMNMLWDRLAEHMLEEVGLQAEVLTETTERRLMLLYNPEQLSATLQQPRVEQVLTSIGYEEGITKKIALLQQRTNGEEFPHEIGFFLGYPIKDVLGFMGRVDLPLSKMGPWKIYGDPEPSLRLISRHSRARKSIRQRLNRTTEPYKLLFHEALVA